MDWHAWKTALGPYLIARSSASAAAAAICEFARHFDEAFTFTGRHQLVDAFDNEVVDVGLAIEAKPPEFSLLRLTSYPLW
jgi:hypothetical protein